MEKSHSVAFVAFKTGDTLIIIKQYPEWNLAVRIPARGLGSCFGIARSTDYSRKSFSISIGSFVMFDKERVLAHFNQHKCQ